jgi:hypothetical protein
MADPVSVVSQFFDNANNNNMIDVHAHLANPLSDGVANFRKDMPDARWSLKAAVADGNAVAFQYVGTGTDPTTRRKLSWTGGGVAVIEDDKVSQLLELHEDKASRDLQLGKVVVNAAGGASGRWISSVLGLVVVVDVAEGRTGNLTGTVSIENVGKVSIAGRKGGGHLDVTLLGKGFVIQFSGDHDGDEITGSVFGLGKVKFRRG